MTEIPESLADLDQPYVPRPPGAYDSDDPLAPIKAAVKDADPELVPGRVVQAVEAMVLFGMDKAAMATVRAYIKRQKLLSSITEFDEVVGEAQRARRRALRQFSPPSHPPAEDAHLLTPPAWAHDQDILARVVRTLRVCMGLVGERRNVKMTYLAITSRLLDKQVSLVIKGLSSSGKSYTIECVVRLFPEEAVYTMTAMSEHALIYLDEELSHRTVVLYEAAALREGREKVEDNQTAYIVRSLLSEGRIEYPTVIRDGDGTLRTVKLVKEGPTNLVTSTTSISLHGENETRMFSLPSNDSQEQTRAVMVRASVDDEPARDLDLSEWHDYQRWLAGANHSVTIPYAACIAAQIPPVAVRLRRDWNAVRALIRTHAMMHQIRREIDVQGRIVATLDDYQVVRSLVSDLVAEGIGATVPESVRQTVEAVATLSGVDDAADGITVTVAAVAAALKLERSAASRRLHTARDRGFLVNAEEKRGRAARYKLGEPMPGDVVVLPDAEDVCTGPCTHVEQYVGAGQDCDCSGVCRCADAADHREGEENNGPRPSLSPSSPSAGDAHLHTLVGVVAACHLCGEAHERYGDNGRPCRIPAGRPA